MPGPVVVEVTAASPDVAQITALVEACGRAVGHTTCLLARQAPEPPYEAVAIVTWLGDARVRVEVGLRSGEHSDWRSRELAFQPSDFELERWRAIGFVVGTLASAAAGKEVDEQAEAAAAAKPPPVVVGPAEPAAAPATTPEPDPEPQSERLAWLGLGWFAGDGLDARLERNGAWGRIGVRPAAAPIVAFVSGRYSTSSRSRFALSASWLDAGVGLGVALLDTSNVVVDLGLELSAERFSAEANQAFVGSSARERWIGALRLRPEFAFYWSEAVGASAFGELSLRGGQTHVSVGGQSVGETSLLGYAFGLGLCVRALR